MSYRFKTNIANRKNYGSPRALTAIKWIVIHMTANDGDSDENNGIFFRRNVVKASAHYFVDDDSVTQSVPDNFTAYSVGGRKYPSCKTSGGGRKYGLCNNLNSLNVELCDTKMNGMVYPTQATIDNAISLVQSLMRKYKIPQDHVIRHFDVTGKACPAYWCGNVQKDLQWKARFWNGLGSATAAAQTPAVGDYSLVFDATYYAGKYPDLAAAGIRSQAQLLDHFVNHGMAEGRIASASFNVQIYQADNPDLQQAFGNNMAEYFRHYMRIGHTENRRHN